jgi:hypothetical protein
MRRGLLLATLVGSVTWGWAIMTEGANPVTQGELAACLCKKLTDCGLKSTSPPSGGDLAACLKALVDLGIEPHDGWQPNVMVKEGVVSDLTDDVIRAAQSGKLACALRQAVDSVATACACAGLSVGEVIGTAIGWGYFFPPMPGQVQGGGVVSPNR